MEETEAAAEVSAEGEYASSDAVASAIQSLSDTDIKKLMIIATSFWRRRKLQSRWADPADLLHDAMLLTLQKTRRWRNSSVDIAHHLDRVMESISGHLARHGLTDTVAREAVPGDSGLTALESVAAWKQKAPMRRRAAA